MELFAASVPTIVLASDQRILDWNPAFDLAFQTCAGLTRGGHIGKWYEELDNYRRVAKRVNRLYGEGVLPITDRERLVYVSPIFGRMVFTRLMGPVIDQTTGRIVGWTITLNINSVAKREEFFTALQRQVAKEVSRRRHAAAQNRLFHADPGLGALNVAVKRALERERAESVLDLGCGTGGLASYLLGQRFRVTAVEDDIYQLRVAREAISGNSSSRGGRLIRQNPEALRGVPVGRFDAVVMHLNCHRYHHIGRVFEDASSALADGGILIVTAIVGERNIDNFFEALRGRLAIAGALEELKYQLAHVIDHERAQTMEVPYQFRSRAELVRLGEANGFGMIAEESHCGGDVRMLVFRKRGDGDQRPEHATKVGE